MLPIEIKGIVTKYKGNGRKLGYPTANLDAKTNLKDGVYFGHADLKEFKSNPALIFIGTPTTMGDAKRRVEAYLLDIPDIDYYGEKIKITVETYHRPSQTFDSVDNLLLAMKNDEAEGRAAMHTG